MTYTYIKAKKEFDIIKKSSPNDIILEFEDEILALCEKFGLSGQSGGSAPHTASALTDVINRLLLQDVISPVTGDDDEWGVVSSSSDYEMYQNKRCSSLFKDSKFGKSYYLDAITMVSDNGSYLSGSFFLNKEDAIEGDDDKRFLTRAYVKSFPFIPKTFTVDIIDIYSVSKIKLDMYISDPIKLEMYISDPSQLDDILKYYDKIKSKSEMRDDIITDILN